MTGTGGTERSGAVYDRGYRPYDGPRGGRRAAVLALCRASARRALGLRRSWRQKLVPFSLLAVVSVPAAVNVGIGFLTRNLPQAGFEFFSYRDYVGVSSALLLFLAVCAPDVVCPERRQRVLPILFARPLTGGDYVIAKLGAVTGLLFAFSLLPQAMLFVGRALVSDGVLTYMGDNAGVLWKVPTSVAALAIYYAAFGLAVSCLTSRRVVAGAAILGITLVSSTVSEVLTAGVAGWAELLNLLGLPLLVRDLVFLGHLDTGSVLSRTDAGGALALGAYLAVLVLSIAVLVVRYRTVEK